MQKRIWRTVSYSLIRGDFPCQARSLAFISGLWSVKRVRVQRQESCNNSGLSISKRGVWKSILVELCPVQELVAFSDFGNQKAVKGGQYKLEHGTWNLLVCFNRLVTFQVDFQETRAFLFGWFVKNTYETWKLLVPSLHWPCSRTHHSGRALVRVWHDHSAIAAPTAFLSSFKTVAILSKLALHMAANKARLHN